MKKYFLLSCIIVSANYMKAQNEVDGALKNDVVEKINKKKTANTKDILTSLYRAGIDNLLGKEHQFSFSSTFYGVDSLLRKSVASEAEYKKERFLRSNSFDLTIKGDSSNNITEFGGGFTFTLLNKKDVTYTKIKELSNLMRLTDLFASVRKKVNNDLLADPILSKDADLSKKIQESWSKADKNKNYKNLIQEIKQALKTLRDNSAEIKTLVESINTEKGYSLTEEDAVAFIDEYLNNGVDIFHETYVAITELYARKPLWTFAPAVLYDKINKQASYFFGSAFTVSLGKNLKKKPWELEAKVQYKIENDTSVKKTNYDNKPLSLSLGVNKVLIENEEKESKMEFKFFTQYDYQTGKVSNGQKVDMFTLNSTLRINVYKSLWLPVTLKYDPDNHNFLGVFSITANLGN